MLTDRQVKKLFALLASGKTLHESALRSGMSERTARKYRKMNQLPSDAKVERSWRTRKDPFESVWDEVVEQLRLNPGLQATTVFDWVNWEHPNQFDEGQLRSLQRRIKQWRATEGPAKEVFFSQIHHPGDLGASDFTYMNSLGVTIGGHPFEHLVYHFVLTYSNWESVSICSSESFESLSEGLQSALWKLGGVPVRHRTDRLSAAVNNLSDKRDFTARYQALMDHYGLAMEKTQAGHGNENGDVESSHDGFKTAVDQALMMRGSRDFESVEAYDRFLQEIADRRNTVRKKRLAEDREVLRKLPRQRLEGYRKLRVRVNKGSLIQILANTYSVHSRLIGERVDARVHADHIEIWYAQKKVDQFPRLRGRGKHRVNYRHIIDWLVRKPGAFENYRYQKDLFPNSYFRMAYDTFRDRRSPRAAVKDYLEILRLAAYESESRVADALRTLIDGEDEWSIDNVRTWVQGADVAPEITDVKIDSVDLTLFDCLLDDVFFSDVSVV